MNCFCLSPVFWLHSLFTLQFKRQIILITCYLTFKSSSFIALSPFCLRFQQIAQRVLCTWVFLIEMQTCHIFNDVQILMKGNIQLFAKMTGTLADIWFILDVFPHINEVWNGSEYIWFPLLFSCLHIHNTHQICSTWKKKIRIGPLEPSK